MLRVGRWYAADLRPWGMGRVTLRNPKASGWPHRGDKTESADIAQRWALLYVDLANDETRRVQLGKAARLPALSVAVERFLDARERGKSYRTWAGNRAALTTHFLPYIGGDTPLDAIDTALVQRWADRLLVQGYALSTIRFYLKAVRVLCRSASAGAHDPTHGVALPAEGERDVRAWTDEEIARLRDAADALDAERPARQSATWGILASYRRFLELGLSTGLRSSEMAALEWTAFRESDRTVRVTQQVRASGHGLAILKGKTNRTALVLPEWWAHHRHDLSGRVLLRPGIAGCGAKVMSAWMRDILDRAELNAPGVAVHSLRHTYARLFIEKGGRLEELQKSLGHSSITITERFYGHMTEQSAATLARWRIYGEDARPRLVREVHATTGKVSGSGAP